jgi:scyllo-inositol 2-dehydrogenase (NAD+)
MSGRLNVGVIGVGRMGRVYATNLAQRVPNARLVAVADRKTGIAESFAKEFAIDRFYESHHDLLDDPAIDAVAVITSTSTHKEVIIDAARAGKAVFCEKPISLSLEDADEILRVLEETGVFLQMGFQRRFDTAYVAARRKVEEGAIGSPVVFTSISRDPFRPPLEFCDPKVSGGLIADMGIHDFDVARMYMGEVKSVHAIGGTLAYPEMNDVGDIDNAIVNMVFVSGALGLVGLSRNAVFGYDIRGEIWGTKGSIQIGYFRQTPIVMMTKDGISHDAVPYFFERFESAYLTQIQDFVENVRTGQRPSVTGADAVAAMRISLAANASFQEKRPVEIGDAVTPPTKARAESKS